MLETSEVVSENPKGVKDILISVCNILFGVSPGNINSDLINVTCKAISDRFIGITIQDVKNAYQDAEIEKKQYISITRDELILPIKQYWAKKTILISKIKEIEWQVRNENEAKIQKKKFEEDSIRIFEDSIAYREWMGTAVNAFSVLSQHKEAGNLEIIGKFDQVEKDEIFHRCIRENNSAKHIELDKCAKEEVSKWLEKLVDPKWLFANELIKLYFQRYVNI